MHLDFDGLGQGDYELFLPTPVFSQDKVVLELTAGAIYSDVIRIINRGEGLFHTEVETVGQGLTVENEQLTGNDIALIYNIDTMDCKPGDELSAFLLLSYLGGEKQINFIIRIIEEDEVAGEPEVSEVLAQGTNISHLRTKPYRIQQSKKAYDISEKARIMIMNHDIYPIGVKVLEADRDLFNNTDHMTVEDIGFLEVGLKKSLFDRIMPGRRKEQSPAYTRRILLEITSEEGKERILAEIVFTNFSAPVGARKIKDDKSFRKATLQSQKLYVRYLLLRKKHLLKDALKLCEDAMAYHPTDVTLRLLYMMILLDLNLKDKVYEQVVSLIPYADYYEENDWEEFSDIVQALYHFLRGEPVLSEVRQWPLTVYRQMFRYHVFEKNEPRFRDYENLYEAGIRSVYIYAETVSLLNKHPEIPIHESPYYTFLLKWALGKGHISDKWLAKLDMSWYQLQNYNLVSATLCFDLYTLSPTEGMLRLLGEMLAATEDYSPEAYAIYYEMIVKGVFLKDVLMHYIRAAYRNRLKIELDYSQLSVLHSRLLHDESVYLYLQFREKGLKDAVGIHLVKRYYNEIVASSIHRLPTEDEVALVAKEVSDMAGRHQLTEIQKLVDMPFISHFAGAFDEVLATVISLGCDEKAYVWLEKQLPRTLIIEYLEIDRLKGYFEFLVGRKPDSMLTYTVALNLYQKGCVEISVLMHLAVDFRGSLQHMLELNDRLQEAETYSLPLMEKILYRGIMLRTAQHEVFDVYRSYRNHNPRREVCAAVNRYFAAQILIEDMFGSPGILSVLEEDMSDTEDKLPIGLAILKLYGQLGVTNEVISANLLKNSVKNGIIFPWFKDLAMPYITSGQFRKAVFFSYHSRSHVDVTLHYLCDDQEDYTCLKMKHVAFGMYIGYFVAFYLDHISYYYEEVHEDGHSLITESGIHVNDRFSEPLDEHNTFDTVNTVIMGRMMNDTESVTDAIIQHAELRQRVIDEMVEL